MRRKIFIAISLLTVLAAGVIFMISKQSKPLDQPLIPPEDEHEVMVDEYDMNEDETIESQDEDENEENDNNFTDRISTAIQSTISKVFHQEVNIVAIGDSLTHGVGDASSGGGYVGILERSINQEKQVATFENFGVPGNRTDQLLKRLEQKEIQDALEEADLVLVTIGANDIMEVAKRNITNLELEDFVAEQKYYEMRLGEILEKIQSYNPNAEIYLLGIYNPFEKYFGDIAELNMIVDAWNDTSNSITLEMENITFVPIVDLFNESEENIFADDNFHPNYHGYYLIAERVLEYISNDEG